MRKRLKALVPASFQRTGWRKLAIALLCAWVALAPSLAEARAGSSSAPTSLGSRGSRTYDSGSGQSMQRSMTPPAAPQAAPRPAPYAAPAYGYGSSWSQRNPFLTGLFGGFIGAGIAGMLFGHGMWGGYGEVSPFGSMLGMLLQFALIGGLVWFALSLFRRRPSFAGMSDGGYYRQVEAMPPPQAARPAGPVEIPISEADFNEWGQLLGNIQSAWSGGDLQSLRQSVTPEMLSYFAEELAGNASQGVENRVEDVNLLKGDLQEAWREGDIDYATARLRWSARDYTVRPARPGEHEVIVAGDPARPTEASEIWTFMRRRGGRWLLSAIQQV